MEISFSDKGGLAGTLLTVKQLSVLGGKSQETRKEKQKNHVGVKKRETCGRQMRRPKRCKKGLGKAKQRREEGRRGEKRLTRVFKKSIAFPATFGETGKGRGIVYQKKKEGGGKRKAL